ncbi:membrane fusion protein (multidrug efflux system) [Chitinophaga niastensis]|uniref:Membrane fusion protein (Multidrug efflux system) n=1 Tax=Chitinophaga niastensis TaxID=536980 RepID=A0A2P8HF49_CHINA|nr:HlyD family secretion protein [Chitinophaga niastensis]PSL44850.1 membrane fusion protein (multidrug efflux system) [Chitinophaga niastensis]
METQTQTKPTNNTTMQETTAPKKKSKGFVIVLAVLVLGGGAFGVTKYIHGLHHEETDNAQIDANVSPVIPRVSGYVKEVRVKDNQIVKKGDTLVILDDRDLAIKVQQAQNALYAAQANLGAAEATTQAAQAGISSSQANIGTIDAQIEAAKVNLWRASQDFDRYNNLIKDHSITQQEYEQASAAKQTAERQLDVLAKQKAAASRQTSVVTSQSGATSKQINVANAGIKQRETDVDDAKLNQSYAVITAPENGVLSKIFVQPGQFVAAGQSLFSVVLDQTPWVVANFKETQLDRMKLGQKVTVHIDAYPEKGLEAKVTSFAPATGSKFALLPPDNASGNFVKVVQRLPVKIEFVDPNNELVKQLRPGMNVLVDVHLN